MLAKLIACTTQAREEGGECRMTLKIEKTKPRPLRREKMSSTENAEHVPSLLLYTGTAGESASICMTDALMAETRRTTGEFGPCLGEKLNSGLKQGAPMRVGNFF